MNGGSEPKVLQSLIRTKYPALDGLDGRGESSGVFGSDHTLIRRFRRLAGGVQKSPRRLTAWVGATASISKSQNL